MPDAKWKAFEREVAGVIGGKRLPANSGHEIDCEGPGLVAQCKLVKRLSLEEITTLTEGIEGHARKRGKFGLVALKVKRGAGVKSPALVVMTLETFRRSVSHALLPFT